LVGPHHGLLSDAKPGDAEQEQQELRRPQQKEAEHIVAGLTERIGTAGKVDNTSLDTLNGSSMGVACGLLWRWNASFLLRHPKRFRTADLKGLGISDPSLPGHVTPQQAARISCISPYPDWTNHARATYRNVAIARCNVHDTMTRGSPVWSVPYGPCCPQTAGSAFVPYLLHSAELTEPQPTVRLFFLFLSCGLTVIASLAVFAITSWRPAVMTGPKLLHGGAGRCRGCGSVAKHQNIFRQGSPKGLATGVSTAGGWRQQSRGRNVTLHKPRFVCQQVTLSLL
jgi:hypothetical protein